MVATKEKLKKTVRSYSMIQCLQLVYTLCSTFFHPLQYCSFTSLMKFPPLPQNGFLILFIQNVPSTMLTL